MVYGYKNVNAISYLPSINRFIDMNWCVVHDLYKLFNLWQLDEWKRSREYGIIIARNGEPWEVYYLSPEEENYIYDCIGYNESFISNHSRCRWVGGVL